MATKFCNNCGTPIDENAAFCPECGAKVGAPAAGQPEVAPMEPEPMATEPMPAYDTPQPMATEPMPAYDTPQPAATEPMPAYDAPQPPAPEAKKSGAMIPAIVVAIVLLLGVGGFAAFMAFNSSKSEPKPAASTSSPKPSTTTSTQDNDPDSTSTTTSDPQDTTTTSDPQNTTTSSLTLEDFMNTPAGQEQLDEIKEQAESFSEYGSLDIRVEKNNIVYDVQFNMTFDENPFNEGLFEDSDVQELADALGELESETGIADCTMEYIFRDSNGDVLFQMKIDKNGIVK